jgi:type 1 glutamine amidotransferase
VRRAALLLVTAGLLGCAAAPDSERPRRKILFFTKSTVFEHSVVASRGGKIFADGILRDLGRTHGWEITHTKDGSVFTPERLSEFDAVLFYSQGDVGLPGQDGGVPMTPENKRCLLDSIERGKGFIGLHSASGTFPSPEPFRSSGVGADPYTKMIGAECIRHGTQQTTRIRCADPAFPGLGAAARGFELMEEWYSFKDYAPDLHVLLVQETGDMRKTGLDSVYARPSYPMTWCRRHGKGRVFYSSLGHREDVWTNPLFQNILVSGIRWALGETEAEVQPNLRKVCPGYDVMPPEK